MTNFKDSIDYDVLPIPFLDEKEAIHFRRDDYYATVAWFNSTKKSLVYTLQRLLIFKALLEKLDLSNDQKKIADKLVANIDKINTYKLKYQL